MKSTYSLLFVLLLFVSVSAVQNAPAQTARTDVYHVHFAKATLGKGAEEADALKQQGPNAPMPGHYLVLRHQAGEDWDYAVIEHLGPEAAINERADMFDEHAVFVARYRLRGLLSVDFDFYLPRRSALLGRSDFDCAREQQRSGDNHRNSILHANTPCVPNIRDDFKHMYRS